jgi:perosamine synthetase
MEIPLCKPTIGNEEIQAVSEVLSSGWLAHGEYNHKFEESFCQYLGVNNAISMNSCTSALIAALAALDIDGEVIIPSMTWVSTANAVRIVGATPVFADVNIETRNVTAETIAAKITPRTKAVMVVHFGGQPCEMTDIVELCKSRKLYLIEDSAETLGATWDGKQAGSFGIGCFSFFPTKNITTGEGGMLTTNDPVVARKIKTYIAHGVSTTTFERERSERPWIRAAEIVGYNFRLSNILAAIGFHQMAKLDQMNAQRIQIAEIYNKAILESGLPIKPPFVSMGATHVYQMYTIQVPQLMRNSVVNLLKKDGVGASVHFDPPVHLQKPYLDDSNVDLPNTEILANTLITLPIYPNMPISEVDFVIEKLILAVQTSIEKN